MGIQIRTAERKKAKLRLGIAAPSGAGKTMGALLLAYGITGDWSKIGFLDTEAGSGELYVGSKVVTEKETITIGDYLYARLDPPFEVKKYIEALHAFEEAGVEVIIFDSISHAWAGAGGLLEKQGRIADNCGNSYAAWRSITPEHSKFVDMMLQSPIHVIATIRSKQEYVQEKNDKGKTVIRKVGMAPVQREGMEYEFTAMLDVDMSHIASASKDRTNTLDGRYFKITPETGKTLKEWLETGKEPPKTAKQLAEEFVATLQKVETPEALTEHVIGNEKTLKLIGEELPKWKSRLDDLISEKQAALSPKDEEVEPKGEAGQEAVEKKTKGKKQETTVPPEVAAAQQATAQQAASAGGAA